MYNCGKCNLMGCLKGDYKNMPKTCPSLKEDSIENIKKKYLIDENYKIAYNAAKVEEEGYCRKTRLEETIDFCKKMNYSRLGIAFCVGLKKETMILIDILEAHDFEVISIICKNSSISKDFIGAKPDNDSGPKYDVMCNPIGQAIFLNESNVDFNIVFGLCVGHDTLAIKYLDKPLTVLAVKDRVLGHNPIQAIYLSDGYYRKKLYCVEN